MPKEKIYEDWTKPHWHRLRKWSESKNVGEFSIVFDSGLPVRVKSKVTTDMKDQFTEVQVKHVEVDFTRELE